MIHSVRKDNSMKNLKRTVGAVLASIVLGITAVPAEPTEVIVRVLSKDAKFVGTSMGGVRINLTDVETGELLATGLTTGSTGDTGKIMKSDRKRNVAISTDGSARFSAMLDIDRPVLVEARAFGPLGQRQSANTVSSTMWVVPGRPVSGGDGWVLQLAGFSVDVLAPPGHIKMSGIPMDVEVRANITMMCGCPIEPDGLWDANRFEVAILLERNGETAGTIPMEYAGSTSQFKGLIQVTEPGAYQVTVFAHDPGNGNTGLDRTTFIAK